MRKICFLMLTAFMIFIAGCGGGGSSSGGTEINNDGRFIGSSTITLSGQGESTTMTLSLEIVIQNNTVISFTSDAENGGQTVSLSIPVSGNSFTILLEQPMPLDSGGGFTCTASIEFVGVIAGDLISGPANGVQDCINNGELVPFTTSGSFSVTRS